MRKGRFLTVAFLTIIVFACDSKNSEVATIDGTSESAKFPDLQMDTWNGLLKNTLSKTSTDANSFLSVARYFVEHRDWLAKGAIENIREAGIPVHDLIDDPNVHDLILNDVRHEIRVELYNHEQYKKNIKNGDFAVALDPDIFYPGATELPSYYFDSKTGEVSELAIPVVLHSETKRNSKERDEAKAKIKFPVFLVSLEDIEEYPVDLSESKLQKTSMTFQRYPYFALYSVLVKDDNEDGNMEFEVYHGNYDVDGDPHFDEDGDHRFNGATRYDAAGRSVYYPDINNKNNTYSMPQWIALQEASSTYNYFMVPIENDINSMKINIDGYAADGTYSKSVQHFKIGTTSTTRNTMYFETAGQGWEPINYYSDDIYDEGGVSRIVKDSIIKEKNGRTHFFTDEAATPLSDINYKLGLEYWPAFLSCGITPGSASVPLGTQTTFYANQFGGSGNYTIKWEYYRFSVINEYAEKKSGMDGYDVPGGGGVWTVMPWTSGYANFTPLKAGDKLRVTVSDTQSGEVVSSTIQW